MEGDIAVGKGGVTVTRIVEALKGTKSFSEQFLNVATALKVSGIIRIPREKQKPRHWAGTWTSMLHKWVAKEEKDATLNLLIMRMGDGGFADCKGELEKLRNELVRKGKCQQSSERPGPRAGPSWREDGGDEENVEIVEEVEASDAGHPWEEVELVDLEDNGCKAYLLAEIKDVARLVEEEQVDEKEEDLKDLDMEEDDDIPEEEGEEEDDDDDDEIREGLGVDEVRRIIQAAKHFYWDFFKKFRRLGTTLGVNRATLDSYCEELMDDQRELRLKIKLPYKLRELINQWTKGKNVLSEWRVEILAQKLEKVELHQRADMLIRELARRHQARAPVTVKQEVDMEGILIKAPPEDEDLEEEQAQSPMQIEVPMAGVKEEQEEKDEGIIITNVRSERGGLETETEAVPEEVEKADERLIINSVRSDGTGRGMRLEAWPSSDGSKHGMSSSSSSGKSPVTEKENEMDKNEKFDSLPTETGAEGAETEPEVVGSGRGASDFFTEEAGERESEGSSVGSGNLNKICQAVAVTSNSSAAAHTVTLPVPKSAYNLRRRFAGRPCKVEADKSVNSSPVSPNREALNSASETPGNMAEGREKATEKSEAIQTTSFSQLEVETRGEPVPPASDPDPKMGMEIVPETNSSEGEGDSLDDQDDISSPSEVGDGDDGDGDGDRNEIVAASNSRNGTPYNLRFGSTKRWGIGEDAKGEMELDREIDNGADTKDPPRPPGKVVEASPSLSANAKATTVSTGRYNLRRKPSRPKNSVVEGRKLKRKPADKSEESSSEEEGAPLHDQDDVSSSSESCDDGERTSQGGDSSEPGTSQCLRRSSRRGKGTSENTKGNKVELDKSKRGANANATKRRSSGHPPNVEEGFECGHCKTVLSTSNALSKHLRMMHGVRKNYSCFICSQQFYGRENLSNHLERAHPVNKCPTCRETFASRRNLKNHMMTHDLNRGRRFECPSCPKKFFRSWNLKIHLVTHRIDKPLKCSKCPKKFKGSDGLRNHLRTHSTQRPFRCNACGKGFKHSFHLKDHIRIHSGQRPHSCEICDKKFTHKSDLSRHIRIHQGEDGKPHQCPYCNMKFIRRDKCLLHQQRRHKSELASAAQSQLKKKNQPRDKQNAAQPRLKEFRIVFTRCCR